MDASASEGYYTSAKAGEKTNMFIERRSCIEKTYREYALGSLVGFAFKIYLGSHS